MTKPKHPEARRAAELPKSMRNMAMVTDAMNGTNTENLASKYNVSRSTVWNVLTKSQEAVDMEAKLRTGLYELGPKAVETMNKLMDNFDEDAATAFKAAALILASAGVVGHGSKDNVSEQVDKLRGMSDEELRAIAWKALEQMPKPSIQD